MDEAMVAQVRRFNRVVTQQVGALSDRFLARDRPLGESRLLWEIGDGRDVRSLRAALDLDSGYVSRLLRSLEAAGLVTTERSTGDRRVTLARLTAAGRAEKRLLDERSDELATQLLDALDGRQRDRLVAAMADVERLLTAATVRFAVTDPDDPVAQHCLRAYAAELDVRFDGGFSLDRGIRAAAADLRPPNGLLLVALLHTTPVGCGVLLFHDAGPAHLKRMWVDASARGLGLGRRLLAELERHAAEAGAPAVRLETNAALTEAIALYRSAGYTEVPAFNAEPYAHFWFEKPLLRQ
ncbi:bifunctional helix-turn-helix transcriptional regulator/GNAT family N-acetyltransferase [Jiangella sp. DSM 45060]|uniref:bifunctional helix-turn-helix transcriptional regulator/GNAT family N-acetyltransferase n=1 Tax=Jiangella sp. DSM 45060 TaxID=1798224 RepID=UPI00087D6110|nr:bifunctional helix-turn-helix transcriptional regulator/GNAT family N-acetyltransferase [Jiangella sp. DSM 45060]SDT66710.1 MarR family protein [Jiangella sp. DSM 45060]